MIAYTSEIKPTIDNTAPTKSSCAFDGSFDVGIKKKPLINAKITIGMFTRKIEPQ